MRHLNYKVDGLSLPIGCDGQTGGGGWGGGWVHLKGNSVESAIHLIRARQTSPCFRVCDLDFCILSRTPDDKGDGCRMTMLQTHEPRVVQLRCRLFGGSQNKA